MTKILFTGSSGLVGSRVYELLKDAYSFIRVEKQFEKAEINCDLLDFEDFKNKIADLKFDRIFHFAAFTNVDEAEADRGNKNGTCYQLNVNLTRNLVELAKNRNAKLTFISTDFVFDGTQGPYSEDSKTGSENDLSWYGWTKSLGERDVESVSGNLIIRISYPFRSDFSRSDFARDMLSRMESKSLYPLFSDQYLTPTFIDNLADFLSHSLKNDLSGIYHVASSDLITPYNFGKILAATFNFELDIQKGSILDFQRNFPAKAKRPIKGGLSVKKLSKINFPSLSNQTAIRILKAQTVK